MIRWALLFLPLLLSALEFKVANYNVENLFDVHSDGGEYEEYQPHNKHGWNEAMLQIKIANIARVITDIDADIIALEEVENKAVLQRLNAALGSHAYPYLFYPPKKPRVNIETALLSRFPIENTSTIVMKDQPRGIHRITLKIDHRSLDVYINHWPAQKEKEEERLIYATTLHNALLKEEGREYLLLGDFNSPYQMQKEWGLGFVTILNAGDHQSTLYNLWYDLPQTQRYSHSYGKQKATLDHIVIPKTLKDGKGIDYTDASFAVFMRPYMVNEKNDPKRWQMSERGRGVHQGEGFSDHFPVTAIFHTSAD